MTFEGLVFTMNPPDPQRFKYLVSVRPSIAREESSPIGDKKSSQPFFMIKSVVLKTFSTTEGENGIGTGGGVGMAVGVFVGA